MNSMTPQGEDGRKRKKAEPDSEEDVESEAPPSTSSKRRRLSGFVSSAITYATSFFRGPESASTPVKENDQSAQKIDGAETEEKENLDQLTSPDLLTFRTSVPVKTPLLDHKATYFPKPNLDTTISSSSPSYSSTASDVLNRTVSQPWNSSRHHHTTRPTTMIEASTVTNESSVTPILKSKPDKALKYKKVPFSIPSNPYRLTATEKQTNIFALIDAAACTNFDFHRELPSVGNNTNIRIPSERVYGSNQSGSRLLQPLMRTYNQSKSDQIHARRSVDKNNRVVFDSSSTVMNQHSDMESSNRTQATTETPRAPIVTTLARPTEVKEIKSIISKETVPSTDMLTLMSSKPLNTTVRKMIKFLIGPMPLAGTRLIGDPNEMVPVPYKLTRSEERSKVHMTKQKESTKVELLPASQGWGDIFAKYDKVNGWKCRACSVLNEADATICVSCSTEKANTAGVPSVQNQELGTSSSSSSSSETLKVSSFSFGAKSTGEKPSEGSAPSFTFGWNTRVDKASSITSVANKSLDGLPAPSFGSGATVIGSTGNDKAPLFTFGSNTAGSIPSGGLSLPSFGSSVGVLGSAGVEKAPLFTFGSNTTAIKALDDPAAPSSGLSADLIGPAGNDKPPSFTFGSIGSNTVASKASGVPAVASFGSSAGVIEPSGNDKAASFTFNSNKAATKASDSPAVPSFGSSAGVLGSASAEKASSFTFGSNTGGENPLNGSAVPSFGSSVGVLGSAGVEKAPLFTFGSNTAGNKPLDGPSLPSFGSSTGVIGSTGNDKAPLFSFGSNTAGSIPSSGLSLPSFGSSVGVLGSAGVEKAPLFTPAAPSSGLSADLIGPAGNDKPPSFTFGSIGSNTVASKASGVPAVASFGSSAGVIEPSGNDKAASFTFNSNKAATKASDSPAVPSFGSSAGVIGSASAEKASSFTFGSNTGGENPLNGSAVPSFGSSVGAFGSTGNDKAPLFTFGSNTAGNKPLDGPSLPSFGSSVGAFGFGGNDKAPVILLGSGPKSSLEQPSLVNGGDPLKFSFGSNQQSSSATPSFAMTGISGNAVPAFSFGSTAANTSGVAPAFSLVSKAFVPNQTSDMFGSTTSSGAQPNSTTSSFSFGVSAAFSGSGSVPASNPFGFGQPSMAPSGLGNSSVVGFNMGTSDSSGNKRRLIKAKRPPTGSR